MDDLNNQGDYISGDVDADGKDVVVGKNIDTRRNQQRNDISVNVLPPGHPANRATVADIFVALTGDALTEKPGLIRRMGDVEKRLSSVEHEIIDMKGLIVIRNESANKIHLSLPQLIIGLMFLLIFVVIVSYMIGTFARGGSLDGRIGLAVSYLLNN